MTWKWYSVSIIVQTNNNHKRNQQCLHFSAGPAKDSKGFMFATWKHFFVHIKSFYCPKQIWQMYFFTFARDEDFVFLEKCWRWMKRFKWKISTTTIDKLSHSCIIIRNFTLQYLLSLKYADMRNEFSMAQERQLDETALVYRSLNTWKLLEVLKFGLWQVYGKFILKSKTVQNQIWAKPIFFEQPKKLLPPDSLECIAVSCWSAQIWEMFICSCHLSPRHKRNLNIKHRKGFERKDSQMKRNSQLHFHKSLRRTHFHETKISR